MVFHLCCLPGEDAGERPALIETQSAVETDAVAIPDQAWSPDGCGGSPAGVRDSEPEPGSFFTVGVDTDRRRLPLGLAFDFMDINVCLVAKVASPSLIHSWNQKCAPHEVVRPRDRLVKVNGRCAEDAERLAKELAEGLGHQAHALLEFQHPVVSTVKIVKNGQALGLSLHYALSENKIGGLCVKSVNEGLVQAQGLGITAGQRVIAMDGEEMSVEQMLQKLREAKEFALTVLSWEDTRSSHQE